MIIFVLFIIFSTWVLTFQLKALSNIMKRFDKKDDAYHVFDEGALADTIMLVLDELQDVMDRNGGTVFADSDSWDSPYHVLATKTLLYEMWGMGDNGFEKLRSRCMARRYPIEHLYSVAHSMRNLAGMENKLEDEL